MAGNSLTDAPFKPSWRIRRRVVSLSLLCIAVWLSHLVFFAPDDELRQTLANGLILAGVAIIGQYVFGAVIDDKNLMSHLAESLSGKKGATPPARQAQPTEGGE